MPALAIPLAVIACCLAGALGGYLLARPEAGLDTAGLALAEGRREGLGEARALGGVILLAHAAAAGMLGYSPGMGSTMALALSLAWGGALIGRLLNSLREGAGDSRGPQAMAFEAMMAVTLALPFWTTRNSLAGPTLSV